MVASMEQTGATNKGAETQSMMAVMETSFVMEKLLTDEVEDLEEDTRQELLEAGATLGQAQFGAEMADHEVVAPSTGDEKQRVEALKQVAQENGLDAGVALVRRSSSSPLPCALHADAMRCAPTSALSGWEVRWEARPQEAEHHGPRQVQQRETWL